ncbi:uncharacterized protein LOC133193717 [Saccostrea echinata]|uniref:uncharacterized protein LOC133193717 n=1 Tax=Saccostrea echinata TaxID=191078 RepID=UPI002A812BF3|nr:uncharacterized protein LOC133193717 [Saccostrea echinata]
MASGSKKPKQISTNSEETSCSNQSDSCHVSNSSEGSSPSKDVSFFSTPESDTDIKRRKPNSIEQSSSQVNSDTGNYSKVPHNLSDWEKKHIENLNIKVSYRPDISPLQLINRTIQKTGLQIFEVRRLDPDEEEKKIVSLVKYVQQSKFMEMLSKINYLTFRDLSRKSLKGLDMYADDRYQCSFIPDELPESLKLWFYRFHTHGKMFAHILHKMVENMEEGIQNYQCHFQHLFETFTKMFGMFSFVSLMPCIEVQKMNIMDTEVYGAPDILYSCHCWKPPVDNEMKKSRIVAICEVKKEVPLFKEHQISLSPGSKTREKSRKRLSTEEISSSSVSCSTTVKKDFPSMSDKLIGQHGGQMLLNYQQSNRCDLIIGLVVQETKVTFTALEMTDHQYQRIKEGKIIHSEKNRPTFTFTKAYDFLKVEDLENIIEPFIRLGLEQHRAV